MLTIYRRNLPHWRLDDATYFVTWRVDRCKADLEPGERDVVAHALRRCDGERYELLAYVVMNDHLHVIVAPRHGFSLQSLVQSWKSATAHCLRRGSTGRVWQAEYLDRIIRSDTELRQKIEYVLANPFIRWPSLTFYPWVWARGVGGG